MTRLLITGASGDLGRPLSARASQTWETFGTYLAHAEVGGGIPIQVDLRDPDAVRDLADRLQPEVIIHTALSDRSPAPDIRTAAKNIAGAARQVSARLIALSTDMVFDGTTPPYSEDSPPTPVSEYGSAKAECERIWLSSDLDCVVVRTSLIYDFDRKNRQIAWMLGKINDGQIISLYTDEMRNPVRAQTLADALLELAWSSFQGILHIAGSVPLSRFDYGCLLLEALGYDPASYVRPVRASDVAPQRPRNLTLDTSRAQQLLRTPLHSVMQAAALHRAHQPTAR